MNGKQDNGFVFFCGLFLIVISIPGIIADGIAKVTSRVFGKRSGSAIL